MHHPSNLAVCIEIRTEYKEVATILLELAASRQFTDVLPRSPNTQESMLVRRISIDVEHCIDITPQIVLVETLKTKR